MTSTKTKRDPKQTLPGAECAIADAISNAELILKIDERPEETAIEPRVSRERCTTVARRL